MVSLLTLGFEFNTARSKALAAATVNREGEVEGDVERYVLLRSFDFCEMCGIAGSSWGPNSLLSVRCFGDRLSPAESLCLCPDCRDNAPVNECLAKAKWVEENLAQEDLLYVTAAVTLASDKVLLCQKPDSKLWEFPGGKLDEGETLVQGLRREIEEELNLQVVVTGPVALIDYDYGRVKIRLFGLFCETQDISTLHLKEHLDHQWCPLSRLETVDLSAADVVMAQKLVLRNRS